MDVGQLAAPAILSFEKSPLLYPLHQMICGAQSWSGNYLDAKEKRKFSAPNRDSKPVPQPSSQQPKHNAGRNFSRNFAWWATVERCCFQCGTHLPANSLSRYFAASLAPYTSLCKASSVLRRAVFSLCSWDSSLRRDASSMRPNCIPSSLTVYKN